MVSGAVLMPSLRESLLLLSVTWVSGWMQWTGCGGVGAHWRCRADWWEEEGQQISGELISVNGDINHRRPSSSSGKSWEKFTIVFWSLKLTLIICHYKVPHTYILLCLHRAVSVRSGKENTNVLVGRTARHIIILKCPILSVFDCIVGLGENIEFIALGCIPSGTRDTVWVNRNKGNSPGWSALDLHRTH